MATKNDKSKAEASGNRKVLPLIAAAVLACAALVFLVNGNRPSAEPAADTPAVIAKGESLVIPISEISEEARFYPFTVDGEAMEVLAVKASDGTIRTAFNTCQSCYTSGAGFYRFEEGELVCNNCGFRFSPDQVEVSSGGCNPWPIFEENKTVTEDSILISYDFLAESKGIFIWMKTAFNSSMP
ncbi:MAG: DUF2318 domain-containing protein [Oscillospiraceae bacterium]|nr:DUF2318 domain-containing protein [Oscillospiraceae bacterium]